MNTQEDKMVVVETCNEVFEAEVIVGLLEANGVHAFIRNCTGSSYLVSPYAGTNVFDVVVPGADLAYAKEILKDCN